MQKPRQAIYKLKGAIRYYDWGGTGFLSELLDRQDENKKPMAEYWLGAHHLSSSLLLTEGEAFPLKNFIEQNKEEILGRTVAKKFGGLPYLLKVLDVKDMLSIQVHPAKHEAELGFEQENKLKIPLDSPQRNYKDDNHKPELMVALGEFWLLHGFKPVKALTRTLKTIFRESPLFDIFDSTGYDQLYKTVMEMPQDKVNELLQPVLDNIVPLYRENKLKKDDQNFWAARAALLFNREAHIDRGILSIYFFNLVRLQKGEGIFQDAGVPHSYLEGQNIEIMASSDNVLRGGLTNKHVSVPELMKHIRFEETNPHILHPRNSENENIFSTKAPDFRLSQYQLGMGKEVDITSVTGEILLVMNGSLRLQGANQQMILTKGEAVFSIAGTEIKLNAISDAELFRASVPVHMGE